MQSDHEFQNWTVIGKGAERVCFQNPSNPAQCVKLSQKDAAKQTYREIQFFERLKNKNVQFTHIPKFLGKGDNQRLKLALSSKWFWMRICQYH